ncbi:hypothetical protein WJ70_28700 [Burkholderia ubonensis]|nr:hypothetical protein WJ70_28700 [Burkholderia ubonensis]
MLNARLVGQFLDLLTIKEEKGCNMSRYKLVVEEIGQVEICFPICFRQARYATIYFADNGFLFMNPCAGIALEIPTPTNINSLRLCSVDYYANRHLVCTITLSLTVQRAFQERGISAIIVSFEACSSQVSHRIFAI